MKWDLGLPPSTSNEVVHELCQSGIELWSQSEVGIVLVSIIYGFTALVGDAGAAEQMVLVALRVEVIWPLLDLPAESLQVQACSRGDAEHGGPTVFP